MSGTDNNQTEKREPGKRPRTPALVQRKTALRGQAIVPPRIRQCTVRRNTEDDLHEKNPEIPYVKAERAIRDLVCSLMERQDRMNEELLQRIIDLQYRMDDLEADLPVPKRKNNTGGPGAGA